MTIIRTTEPRGTFRVTYETVTAESAECGDAADRGYLAWDGSPADDYWESQWDFRDLVDKLSGHLAEGDGDRVPRWVTVDPQSDWWLSAFWRGIASDPDETLGVTASVHRPDWITDASWLRVCRILGWRQR
jgi:hypothetical protein